MIIPSIDLMDGGAVQLVGGRDKALDAGDPLEVGPRFAVVGELAVIDLDAALGRGSNTAVVSQLIRRHRCRVGGGIRSVEAALRLARPRRREGHPRHRGHPRGARRAAPRAGDRGGRRGRRRGRGRGLAEGHRGADARPHRELRDLVGGFLVTFVEREGRLGGIDLEAARRVVEAAGGTHVTVAGGVTTAEEVAAIDRLGADAQVGMALYTGRLDLADAFAAPLVSDRPDGLWPTVVVDEHGIALGLAWSDRDSLREAVSTRRGVYHSRSRGLWVKGETSGATQELLRVDLDCDRDALRFTVRQAGAGFCHRNTRTCWGDSGGLGALERRLAGRLADATAGSYTVRLARDPERLAAKLVEEAAELGEARSRDEVVWEAADVLYFTVLALARAGVPLEAVVAELDRRAKAVRRRDGSRLDVLSRGETEDGS